MNDIIDYLKQNNYINTSSAKLNMKKTTNILNLKYESLSKPKIYFDYKPSIKYKDIDIELKDFDCYMLEQYKDKKVLLCFKSQKIFYIYTTGLAYDQHFLENFFNLFLPKFLEFFKDIIINILNFDNFDINNEELYAFNESYINKNTELNLILKKNNLKLFNFFYDEYFTDENINIIKNENTIKNYIILDFGHIFKNIYIKKRDIYILEPHEDLSDSLTPHNFFINNIYFGFDNLYNLHESSFLNDILEHS